MAKPAGLRGYDVTPGFEVGGVLIKNRWRFKGGGNPLEIFKQLTIVVGQSAVKVEKRYLGAFHGDLTDKG
jgi:hypothetical protein